MTDRGKYPAFPVEVGADGAGRQTGPTSGWMTGIDTRTYLVAAALSGMANVYGRPADEVAAVAVELADAALAAMEESGRT